MDEHAWILATVAAAFAQTLRNALQRGLTAAVGVIGATHVRFLFGLPFALAFLAVIAEVTGRTPPLPGAAALGWIGLGAATQIGATALMLAAMRRRSFVVVTALTKTEPVQVLLVALVVLGEVPTPMLVAAVLVATLGVLVLSWPGPAEARAAGGRPGGAVVLGLGSAALIAVSAVAYRGGILALDGAGDPLAAATALVVALTMQATALGAWLAWRNRPALGGIARAWRPSLLAGFMGAAASLGWFTAFALQETAAVRTLALVELLFAQLISLRLLRERTTPREAVGLGLLVVGVALVLEVD